MHEISVRALVALMNVPDPTSGARWYLGLSVLAFSIAIIVPASGLLRRFGSTKAARASVAAAFCTAAVAVGGMSLHAAREHVESTRAASAPKVAELCQIVLAGVEGGDIRVLRQAEEDRVVGLCGRDEFIVAVNSPRAEVRLASALR